jgi:hypothetical protein
MDRACWLFGEVIELPPIKEILDLAVIRQAVPQQIARLKQRRAREQRHLIKRLGERRAGYRSYAESWSG